MHEDPVYRLRRYEQSETPRVAAPLLLVPPLMVASEVYDISPDVSAVAFLQKQPLGPNVTTFLGHSDLRTRVMGLGRAVDPGVKPTSGELAQMERLLEDLLFDGPDLVVKIITIDEPYVDRMLADIVRNEDLSRYIL